jgi:Predicted transcriptional regulators
MRISDVSRLSGASAKAIRLYEARGLLPPIARVNRYRHYSEQDLAWIRLIRLALSLGIPLAAIASLKQADGQMDWPAVLALLQRRQQQVAIERERLAQVHARLQQLDQELRHWLQDGGQCGAGGDPCPSGV